MNNSENKTDAEIQVSHLIANFIKAFSTRDVNLMMSLYAPEFVAFDIVPPLQDVGAAHYRQIWEKVFVFFRDGIALETRELRIIAGEDVAFSHQLLRLRANLMSGEQVDRWERLTFCFRKIDSQWLILHEHVSVPADLMTGRAAVDLIP